MDLEFLSNQADEDEGLSNAGIETFRDAPYASVARECGQNSRDAHQEFPVVLRFDQIQIPVDTFPSLNRLQGTIDACLKRARSSRDPKELQFFTNAKSILENDKINALAISDFGTRGLVGPSKPGTPFHSLLKGAGVSVKNSQTSGGSFGIGKNAAFAVSELHTVFYSTLYGPEPETTFLAQGKCTLVSHEDESGKKLRATGYWGSAGFLPIHDPKIAPSWLRREKTGTTAIAIGFPAMPTWDARVAESLVRNFFAAVHRGEMEFYVDDEAISITKTNLSSLFKHDRIMDAADQNGSSSELEFAKHLYTCLVSPTTFTDIIEIKNLGKFKLSLLVEDGLPKRVAILRNGMMITDSLQYFGDKLTRFAMYKDFVAVLEPIDDTSNQIIKELENPRHDQLSVERIQDRKEQSKIRKAMLDLRNQLREGIKKYAVTATEDTSQIGEMNQFFSDTSDDDRLPDPNSAELNPERIQLKLKGRLQRDQGGNGKGNAGGSDGKRGKESGGNGGVGRRKGNGVGGTGSLGPGGLIQVLDLRTFSGEKPRVRDFSFTPSRSATAQIHLEAVGASESTPLTILRVNGAPFNQRRGQITLHADTRQTLSIETSEQYGGPIEISFREAVLLEGHR